MFKRETAKENLEQSTHASETVVGHSVKIEGDLVSDGDIKVDGIVSGKVKTSKALFVGPTAKIEADVEAGSVTVAGIITGNVTASDLVVVMQTGSVKGDINCRSLAIEEGAYFAGRCTMAQSDEGKKLKSPLPEDD